MELGSRFISIYDFILLPVYLLIVYSIAKRTKEKNIGEHPEYKYYMAGLFAKISGGILFTLIYVYYYGAGDTTNYFVSAKAISRLFFEEPLVATKIMLGNNTLETWIHFNADTGHPLSVMFLYKPQAFAVMRLLVPFTMMGLNFIIPSAIILASFAYAGIWKFYSLLSRLYPSFYKMLAIGALFIPSVVFWGSGLMKDTFTLTATLWIIVNVFRIFIHKEKILKNSIILIINIHLLLWLKPYILIALIPSIITLIVYTNIRVKSNLIKFVVSPLLLFLIFFLSYSTYNFFSAGLEQYGDMESMLKKAKVTQQDLIRAEQYGVNFYNIGEFDPTIEGIVSKAHIALISGLFRPFIWEAKGFVPLLSALESLFFIGFTLYVILNIGLRRFFKFVSSESPLVPSFFIFALFLAFAVGLTTANFGALVRYRIPLLPFYFCGILIVYGKWRRWKKFHT